MNLTWFEKSILRIFLPSFSESDLISLIYPILIAVLLNSEILMSFVMYGLTPTFMTFEGIVDSIKFLLGIMILGFVICVALYLVVKHSLSSSHVSKREKSFLIFVYYCCVFSLTLLSFMYYVPQALSEPNLNVNVYWINIFFHFFVIGKIFFGFLLLSALEEKYPEIHRSRMTDVQISKLELIILLVLEAVMFFMLYRTNHIYSTIFLSWTYSVILYKGISEALKHLINSLTIYNHG